MKKRVQEFLHYSENIKQKSLHTVKAYDVDLRQFLTYLKTHEEIETLGVITEHHIKSFIAYLYHEKVTKRSINRKISTIKSFFHYLISQRQVDKDITLLLVVPKFSKKLPTVLTLEEIDKLRENIDIKEFSGIRNRMIIELLYSSGLRASELLSICEGDIHFSSREIRVLGKGDKQRDVFFSNTASEWITHFIKQKRLKGFGEKKLIVNQTGEPLSDRSLRRIIEDVSKNSGISKHVSPHTFRHSFATHLMNRGIDLRYIQALLGHEHITTTEVYTHVSREKLKEELEKYHPFIEKER